MTGSPDWRLEVAFDDPLALPLMQRRIREGGEFDEEPFTQAEGVAALFAYAATREELERLRARAEALLGEQAGATHIRVSKWDPDVESWRQVDPPLDGEARELDEALARAGTRDETRTLPCTVGRLEREIFESCMRDQARRSRHVDAGSIPLGL